MQRTAHNALEPTLIVNGARHAPGRSYPTPLHFFLAARRDPLVFLRWAASEYGDVVRFDAWPLVIVHLLYHPDHIKHVLQDNNRNYWKGNLIGRVKPLIGEGLFTSEGDFWRRQRRLAQPAFHRQRIEGFATIMTECTQAMLERWEMSVKRKQTLEVLAEMSNLTNLITTRALFSSDMGEDVAAICESQR